MSDRRVLVDTNVLVAATDAGRADHARAVGFLRGAGELVTAPQVVREYLVVATRPVARNGLGMGLDDALANVRELRRAVQVLPEDRDVLPVFLDLLADVAATGRRLHDAWLVATARAHGVTVVATSNTADFAPWRRWIRVQEP